MEQSSNQVQVSKSLENMSDSEKAKIISAIVGVILTVTTSTEK